MRHVLSLLNVMSANVERKHLLAQASKPRKRGRAMTAANLAKATLVMSIKEVMWHLPASKSFFIN